MPWQNAGAGPAGGGDGVALDLETVRRLRPAVEARSRRTPLRRAGDLEARLGTAVWLKLECQQVTGSFKVRGPLALRAVVPDARRWVTASAGNHGLGVAWAQHGSRTPPLVFVPRASPQVKRAAIAALDAEVRVVEAPSYDAAEDAARRWAADHDGRFVSAFDDEVIMAGNGGTLGLEILEALPDAGSILVPVGGGGLASGLGCVVRALRPAVRLVGVQSEATPAMYESFRSGRAVLRHSGPPTLCEGLEGGVSRRSYDYARRWLDQVVLVSESAVARAMRWAWEAHGLRLEGSAAVGPAACLEAPPPLPGPVCIVLTGCNVDDDTWERATGLRP
jgi:threonine dehydratase